jgi:PIN domain nuclease of toxin-antitoxin system
MQTLLDTHAWVWWVTEDRRLSRTALRAIDKAQASDALWLSMISVWEVAKKTEKRQLVLDRPLDDWFDLATTRGGLHLAELTRPILTESCRLPAPFHGDPADQIIVATARDRDAVVVTKDKLIRDYTPVRTIW